MPELTCPNPECKGDLKPHVERCLGGGGYAVVCPACDMSGPYADTEAEAIRLFLLLGTAGEAKWREIARELAVALAPFADEDECPDVGVMIDAENNEHNSYCGCCKDILAAKAALAHAREAHLLPEEAHDG